MMGKGVHAGYTSSGRECLRLMLQSKVSKLCACGSSGTDAAKGPGSFQRRHCKVQSRLLTSERQTHLKTEFRQLDDALRMEVERIIDVKVWRTKCG